MYVRDTSYVIIDIWSTNQQMSYVMYLRTLIKNLTEGVGNQNCYLLLTTANNNTAQECLWNCSITSGNPSGMYLVEVDGN